MRLYFDSNIFIYALESETSLGEAARDAFAALDSGGIEAFTSQLTLAEVLPVPLREGRKELVDAYEHVFAGGTSMEIVAVSSELLRSAARLVALSGLRLPDALHVATALEGRCEGFLTEDARLPLPPEIRLTRLSAGVAGSPVP